MLHLYIVKVVCIFVYVSSHLTKTVRMYEGWNFNSGNYLFTTDTK